jgi:purine-binding chemotaxis protein CheW
MNNMIEQTENTNEENDSEQFLSFKIGDELYGLNILRVQEIKGWEATTPIPGEVPKYMKGMINLRGAVIPIFDLRIKFGMKKSVYDKKTVVIITKIIVNDEEKTMGIVVDSVQDTRTIQVTEIHQPPELGSSVDSEFIKGISSIDENMLVILDIDKLINIGILNDTYTPTKET